MNFYESEKLAADMSTAHLIKTLMERNKELEASLQKLQSDYDSVGAGGVSAQRVTQKAAPVMEYGRGDVLPAVVSRVFIRHGRDDDAHACTVTGYYAWGDHRGNKHLHRVFVRMVYEGTNTEQARALCDCYPSAEAALAATPTTPAPMVLPEPVAVIENGSLKWKIPTGEYSIDVELIRGLYNLYTEQQVRELLAAHGITQEKQG